MPADNQRATRRTLVAILVLVGGISSGLRAGVHKDLAFGPCSTQAAADGRAVCENVVFHGLRDRRAIALTFDACPRLHVEKFSEEIVDFLKDARIPATFFVSGKWAEACPECLRQLEETPLFEIALHGYNHRKSTGLSEDAIAAEIELNKAALIRLGAHPQPFFRPPYGDCPVALTEAARRLGVIPVMWDVEPGDPVASETPDILERRILRTAQGGSIVVLHVNGGGVWTAQALPHIVATLREKGFTFVKVSDLLGTDGLNRMDPSQFSLQEAAAHPPASAHSH
jgi:peptidoglycan/xylan/chitin deacetylase (PgdA/CDA1 family)